MLNSRLGLTPITTRFAESVHPRVVALSVPSRTHYQIRHLPSTIIHFMDTARIAELLQPFLQSAQGRCHSEPAKAGEACPGPSRREPAALSPAQLQSISTYIDILLRWNARINLTAIRDPEEIVLRHFGESLFAARHLFPGGVGPGLRSGEAGQGS